MLPDWFIDSTMPQEARAVVGLLAVFGAFGLLWLAVDVVHGLLSREKSRDR